MKIKTIYIFFLFSLSCGQIEVNFSNIEYIEVYSISIGIHTPFGINEKTVREVGINYKITDEEIIELIASEIKGLKISEEQYFPKQDIYIACDLFFKSGVSISLLYNGEKININDIIYDENSSKLIDLILEIKAR